MDLRRVRHGEWIAAAGGVTLLASLFMTWYMPFGGVDPLQDLDRPLTGFESFDVLDIVLVVIAALAIALAVLQATRDSPAIPVGAGVLTVVFGALGVLLVAYRIVNQPGPNELIEVRAGAWVGLLATVAIAVGGWESIRDERVRGLPPGPEPELRPTPPPDA
jgi:hypothetical protein